MNSEVRKQLVGYIHQPRKWTPVVRVPRIRLIGKWLAEAGFLSGQRIFIHVQENKLTIMGKMKDLAIEEQQRQAVIGNTGDEDYQYEVWLHQQNRIISDLLTAAKVMHHELTKEEIKAPSGKRQEALSLGRVAIEKGNNWLIPDAIPPEAYEDEATVLRIDAVDGDCSRSNERT